LSDIDPMPDSKKTGTKDRLLSGWCDPKTGELVADVVVKPGVKVVDIGCGDGGYIGFCSAEGADVTFVDIQGDKVEALEKRLKEHASGEVKGIVSDCDPIPLPDGCADIVMSTEVLEHVHDPQKFLNEIVRLGTEDATYILTVPDARGEYLIKPLAHPSFFEEPNHIQIFDADQFTTLVENAGLEVVRHEFLGGFWAVFYLLKCGTSLPGETINDAVHPATVYWTKAWDEVMAHPKGDEMRESLNNILPKSQMIVAKRAKKG
jgi:SAM-dependent methyltransferase